MEQSIRQLVVEDEEIDDPAILNVSKNRPIPKVRLRTILISKKGSVIFLEKKFTAFTQDFKNVECVSCGFCISVRYRCLR